MGFTDFFDQFKRYRNPNESFKSQSRNIEAVNALLSSFGNEVFDCSENFVKQDIECRDLSSLTHKDLELLGIRDKRKQDEMLEVFSELCRQDYSWNEVISKCEEQNLNYNNQILSSTNTHFDTMRTALSNTNIKLKLAPSSDVVLNESQFASKFVLDALDELKKITNTIDERLAKLEIISNKHLKKRSDYRFKAVVTFTSILLFLGICLWRKQNI